MLLPAWCIQQELLDLLEDDDWNAFAVLSSVNRHFRKSLRELVVDSVPGIEEIFSGANLPGQLRIVRIEHANIRGPLDFLSHSFSLRRLCLAGCDRLESSLDALSSLVNLRRLNLSGCSRLFGDLAPLSQLVLLVELNLTWCDNLSGNVSPLKRLARLRRLDLDWCLRLKGDLFATLRHHRHLEHISTHRADRLSGQIKLRELMM